MHTELSDTHEAEEMMTQDRAMSNSSLPPSSSESSWESSSESSSSSDVREIRVALEIGHSETDKGAKFEYPKKQEDRKYEGEYDYWLKHTPAVVNHIRSQFESNKDKLPTPTELSIRTFNRGDYSFSLGKMIAEVNAWKPHVAVGLHLNSVGNILAIGHLCAKVNTDAEAVKLSMFINERLSNVQNHHRREDTDGTKKAWSRDIKGGVIVEAGFISSPSDVGFLYYMYEEITEAIASGIYDYMADKGYAGRADSSSSS